MAAQKVRKRVSVVGPRGSRYTLQAGAFLFKSNLRQTEKALRHLGFTPRVTTIRRKVSMIRLRLGVFPPAEARTKLAELKKLTPDAFLLPAGDRLGVFAGSYYEKRQARHYEHLLASKGIHVAEDPVKLAMPLSVLRFGEFADRTAAGKAVSRARAAGLEVELVRQH